MNEPSLEFEIDVDGALSLSLFVSRQMQRSITLHLKVGFSLNSQEVRRLKRWRDDAISEAIGWASR